MHKLFIYELYIKIKQITYRNVIFIDDHYTYVATCIVSANNKT